MAFKTGELFNRGPEALPPRASAGIWGFNLAIEARMPKFVQTTNQMNSLNVERKCSEWLFRVEVLRKGGSQTRVRRLARCSFGARLANVQGESTCTIRTRRVT